MVSIRDVMTDRQLFGDTFGGPSFAAWRALLAGFYGLPLSEDEADTFNRLTGRDGAPADAHDELWLAVGRRGGKSHCAALLAVYEACFRDHRHKLASGEWATVMFLAADRAHGWPAPSDERVVERRRTQKVGRSVALPAGKLRPALKYPLRRQAP